MACSNDNAVVSDVQKGAARLISTPYSRGTAVMGILYVEMGLWIVYVSKDAGCHRSYAD